MNPQRRNVDTRNRIRNYWDGIGRRDLKKIGNQQGADMLTAQARRDGDLLVVQPIYDELQHRSEDGAKIAAYFCGVIATVAFIWVTVAVKEPTPLAYIAAGLPAFLGTIFFFRAQSHRAADSLPAFASGEDHDAATKLLRDVGEDTLPQRGWGLLLLKPTTLLVESSLISLALIAAYAAQVPSAFAMAMSLVVAISVASFAGSYASKQIAEYRKKLGVRERYHRLYAMGRTDEPARSRAGAMREATRNFVSDNYVHPTLAEHAWPYVVVVLVALIMLGLVMYRISVIEATLIESVGMALAAIVGAGLFGLTAFAEEDTISAAGKAGLRAHRLVDVFATRRSLEEANAKHEREVHDYFNSKIASLQTSWNALHIAGRDPQFPSAVVTFNMPFPEAVNETSSDSTGTSSNASRRAESPAQSSVVELLRQA